MLGKESVVDDPDLDWPAPLDLGNTISRTLASTAASDHVPSATYARAPGAAPDTFRRRAAAIGSTALFVARKQQARAVVTHRPDAFRHARSTLASHRDSLAKRSALPRDPSPPMSPPA